MDTIFVTAGFMDDVIMGAHIILFIPDRGIGNLARFVILRIPCFQHCTAGIHFPDLEGEDIRRRHFTAFHGLRAGESDFAHRFVLVHKVQRLGIGTADGLNRQLAVHNKYIQRYGILGGIQGDAIDTGADFLHGVGIGAYIGKAIGERGEEDLAVGIVLYSPLVISALLRDFEGEDIRRRHFTAFHGLGAFKGHFHVMDVVDASIGQVRIGKAGFRIKYPAAITVSSLIGAVFRQFFHKGPDDILAIDVSRQILHIDMPHTGAPIRNRYGKALLRPQISKIAAFHPGGAVIRAVPCRNIPGQILHGEAIVFIPRILPELYNARRRHLPFVFNDRIIRGILAFHIQFAFTLGDLKLNGIGRGIVEPAVRKGFRRNFLQGKGIGTGRREDKLQIRPFLRHTPVGAGLQCLFQRVAGYLAILCYGVNNNRCIFFFIRKGCYTVRIRCIGIGRQGKGERITLLRIENACNVSHILQEAQFALT